MKKGLLCRAAVLMTVVTLMSCGTNSPSSNTLTPAEKVAAAKAALTISFGSGDTASSVTKNITLPTTGSDGTTISWASSDAAVVSTAGVVTQALTQDKSVTLTATISVSGASDTKAFPLTVKAQMTEAEAVAAAKSALTITYAAGDSAASVTKDVTLPATGIDSSTIAWSSNAPTVVSNTGVVARPDIGDANATLTATITVGAASDTKAFPLVVKGQMSNAQAVAAAKAALDITYAGGDSASSVTQNVTLPGTGLDTSTIAWSSSNVAVISNSGAVTRPVTQDANVTLTATITVGAASDTKAFPLVVKAQMTEAQAVAAAKAALTIGYGAGDSAASVTKNVTLPATGIDNSTIAWASSDAAVVSNGGVVTQPLTQDVNVTLTATITVGAASDTKAFPLVVKAQMTEAQAVAAAKAALTIGYGAGDSAASVTKNVTLPATGIDNSTVTWASSDAAVVSNGGVVTQPLTQDVNVTLTATITVGAASDTKAFPLVVKAQVTEAQAVAAAKAALGITYADGDSAMSVTQNVTLPATGIDNSTITWASSDETTISTGGAVVRPLTQDAGVTLTATITVGSASDTKDFVLTVKAQMTDADAVAAAKAALDIGYAAGDAIDTVTQNLSLPTTGLDGCTVAWASSDPAVNIDGTVSRPPTGDLPVTLTATITSNAVSDTKAFIVTVKAQMTDAEAVAAAIQALQIELAEGDSAVSVTQNVTLPATGASGTTITWSSSNEGVLSSTGLVERPSIGNLAVTLTATVTLRAASDTVDFTLTVLGQMSDEDAVAGAKAALQIGYAAGESAAGVTQNVTLPQAGLNACTVSWHSDTPDVISDLGMVTQPVTDPALVTLTATISSHSYSETRDFLLTVNPPMSDAATVAADKVGLQIVYGPGDDISHVTENISLPTSGANGSDITWASSAPLVVSISGGVTVPSDSDANVTLTATISKGLASDTRDFALTVKAMLLSAWVNPAAISPGNGAIEVDPGIVVRIPFQVALDPATVNNESFQIVRTSDSEDVPIIVTYDDPSRTVSLTPQGPLAQDTQYTVAVGTSLLDAGENTLPTAMGFNFTTLGYGDILSQWKFNGDGSDASGKGNDLTDITGDFDSETVHEGSASLYLNGADENGQSLINLGTQLSVAVWVNVDDPIQSSLNTIMSNTGTGEASNGFKLCINQWNTSDESVVIEVGDGSTGGKWVTGAGLIQPGSWYHLVFVIDEPHQMMKIYYNGAEQPLTFVSDEGWRLDQFNYDFSTSGPFQIGSFPGGFYGFKGHLDDMRVYNRVLSADEIAKIAQER